MNPYRIILTDDHTPLRHQLRRFIEGSPDAEVVGEAADGLELVSLLETVVPNMVILDISMPNLTDALRSIKSRYPKVKALVLTMHCDLEHIRRALSAGADGYLLKEDADTEIFSAIRKIQHGKVYVSQSLAMEIIEAWKRTGVPEKSVSHKGKSINIRKRAISRLIAEGKSSQEIAGLICTCMGSSSSSHRCNSGVL